MMLFNGVLIHAQTITVRDISSRDKICNVIFRDKNNLNSNTNEIGVADISLLDKSGDIIAYHAAYSSYTLTEIEKTKSVLEIQLHAKTVVLDEIVLSANRKSESKMDVPYSINVISQKEIEFGNQATSADVLQNTGAIFVQKSQLGGGSPVLRGFEANKVLIVVDGVRMNNAIYRGGHLQDIISLDANMLERTEVLFGPSSTIYGSDALGGVMHFYTKSAELSPTDNMLVKVNSMARYASVNNENTAHLDFNLGWKKIASLTNITYSNFGDLMSGKTGLAESSKNWNRNYYVKRINNRDSILKNSNNNLQIGTAYSQLDVMQRIAIKTGKYTMHNINIQYSQSSDIPRYDRLTEVASKTIIVNGAKTNELRFAEWNYGPQKRLLTAYTLSNNNKSKISDDAKLILAYQKIDQDRISRRFQNANRITQSEDVTVLSLNIDVFKLLANKHELKYGAELQSNAVTSKAKSLNILTQAESKAATRYADNGNSMSSAGIYVSHTWEVNKTFVVTDGIRFTQSILESNFKDTSFIKFPFSKAKQNNKAITGNLGFIWKEADNYKVSVLANTGFRAPNIDDMSKVFESAGNIIIVPNPKIKPEYATNFEFGLSKIFDKNYKFDFTAFYTLLDNALVTTDFNYMGFDTIIINGLAKKVQAAQNKNGAYIYGFSAGVQFDFNKNISFKSIINYTYGRYADVKNDTVVPLDHIPPVFGQSSIMYNEKNTDVEFFVRYNGKKTKSDYSSSGEDNALYSAEPNYGMMPAWFTLNLRFGYNISKTFRLNGSLENITDNRYRTFSSGVNAPGRNFIISLRFKF